MHIEFLWYADCPSHPRARRLLRDALDEAGLRASVTEREVASQAEAEAVGFPGSPTIRIDGRDIDPDGAAAARPALTCRTYQWADGRLQPLPEKSRILAAVTRAQARSGTVQSGREV